MTVAGAVVDHTKPMKKSTTVKFNVDGDVTAENKKDTDSTGFCKSYTIQICGLPALYKKEHVLTLWKKSGLKEPISLLFPCDDSSDLVTPTDASSDKVVDEKDHRKTARFSVASKQQALKAYNVLSGKSIGKKKNYTLKAILNTPDDNFRAARKSRLILRNVSFQCSEDDLKNVFSNYGTVTEAVIPLKPDGKKKGFAFIQFTHVFEAAKAIKAMNMQEIKGRKVAIDWSVPKNKYMEMNAAKSQEGNDKQNDKEGKNSIAAESEDNEDAESESSDNDSEDEDESDDGDEESEESENSEDEMLDDESGDEPSPEEKPMAIEKKHNSNTSHDIHERRTVFVQNISFDTSEESLTEAFTEYGEVAYTKIVLNYETGMSKGCGFVQFKTTEEASSCIDALKQNGLMLDGKVLRVLHAVSRKDATRLKDNEKAKEKADKRNLHLGREGLVRAGTLAAEGLSQIELNKREKIEIAKRAKLVNPDVFFSTTRLCVHNLPRSVDDKKLSELLMSQFKDRRGVRITECRIMRDMKILNEKGQGRPLGYAFVNFTKHEHALKALRSFNNNPNIFGPIKRPIVEFSLENRKALEIKEQRKTKFLAKQRLKKEMNAAEHGSNPSSETATEQKKRKFHTKQNSTKVTISLEHEQHSKASKKTHFERKDNNNRKRQLTTPKSDTTPMPAGTKLPFQGSFGTTASGKKLPLPKHARPKIRTKNKGKILEQMRRSKKLNKGTPRQLNNKKHDSDRRYFKEEGRTKRKRDDADKKDFDDHVSKYSRVLSKKVGQKWYE